MFEAGKIVHTFTTKIGQRAVVRYPTIADGEALTNFINVFSLEDNFTRFAGEQMSLEEEQAYLESELQLMAQQDAVKLFCFVNEVFAGVCDVHRDESLFTRKRHCGILGLIIAKDFRGQGVGEQLIRTTISAATQHITSLKMIKLSCFANNIPALNLYIKIGFTEVGRIPRALFYRNEYVDEVVMTMDI